MYFKVLATTTLTKTRMYLPEACYIPFSTKDLKVGDVMLNLTGLYSLEFLWDPFVSESGRLMYVMIGVGATVFVYAGGVVAVTPPDVSVIFL